LLGRAAALRQPPRRAAALFGLPLARVALTVLVFVGGFAAGTYGAVVASADALPGEPLYAVKRTVEDTTLLLTGDAQDRQALEAAYTERRIEEVRRLAQAGRPAAVEFTGWLTAMNGERWMVAGLPVVVPAGTPMTGTPTPNVWVRVAGRVQPDRTVRAERVVVLSDEQVPLPTATLDVTETDSPTPTGTATSAPTPSATRAATLTAAPTSTPPATATVAAAVGEDVEFAGVVESMGAGAWQISGQAIAVNSATEIRDNPQVGQTVEVRAVRQANGTLLATRIRLQDSSGSTGPSATNTQGSDDDGDDNSGPSPSNTPGSDDGGDDSSGPSPSNTPGSDDGGDDNSGPSASNTPAPTSASGGGNDGGGGDSGPSATNTPKPDDD
jgi:hypothetical protein